MPATHSMALCNHRTCACKAHRLLEGHYLHELRFSMRWLVPLVHFHCFSQCMGKCWKNDQQSSKYLPEPKENRGCGFGGFSFLMLRSGRMWLDGTFVLRDEVRTLLDWSE